MELLDSTLAPCNAALAASSGDGAAQLSNAAGAAGPLSGLLASASEPPAAEGGAREPQRGGRRWQAPHVASQPARVSLRTKRAPARCSDSNTPALAAAVQTAAAAAAASAAAGPSPADSGSNASGTSGPKEDAALRRRLQNTKAQARLRCVRPSVRVVTIWFSERSTSYASRERGAQQPCADPPAYISACLIRPNRALAVSHTYYALQPLQNALRYVFAPRAGSSRRSGSPAWKRKWQRCHGNWQRLMRR